MAETLGGANITIGIALDELRAQLRQAQADVEGMIQGVRKEIELVINANYEETVVPQIESVRESFEEAQDSLTAFGEAGKEAIDKVSESINQAPMGEGIKDSFTEAQDSLIAFGEAGKEAVDKVGESINQTPQIDGIKNSFEEAQDSLVRFGEAGKEAIDKVGESINQTPQIDGIKNSFEEAQNSLVQFGEAGKEAIDKVGESINQTTQIDGFKNSFEQAQDSLVQFGEAGKEAIDKVGQSINQTPQIDGIKKSFEEAQDAAQSFGEAGKEAIDKVGESINQVFTSQISNPLKQRFDDIDVDSVKKRHEEWKAEVEAMKLARSEADSISKSFKGAEDSLTAFGEAGKEAIDKVQSSISGFGEAGKDAFDRTNDSVKEFGDAGSSILKSVSSEIERTIGRTTGLQGAFAGMIPRLVAVGAAAGVALIAIGGFVAALYSAREEVIRNIQADKELADEMNTVMAAGKELSNTFDVLYQQMKDDIASAVTDVARNLVDMWNEMNEATGAGDNLFNSLKNLITSGMESFSRILISTLNLLVSFTGANSDSAESVDNLGDSAQSAASAANTLAGGIDTISNAVSGMIDWISKGITWLRELASDIQKVANMQLNIVSFGTFGLFKQGLSNLGNTTGDGVNFDPNAVGTNNPDLGNFANTGVEQGPGNQAGKNTFNQQQVKNQSRGGSNASKEKEIDLEKEEKKILDEIIDGYRDKISMIDKLITLGQAEIDQRNQVLAAFADELDQRIKALGFSSNIQAAETEVLNIKIKQKQTVDEIIKQEQESYKEIVQKAGKQSENIREYLRDNSEAENRIKALKAQNEGDDYKMALFNINEKYRREIQGIQVLKIAEELKIKTINELEKKKSAEIENLNMQANARQMSFIQSGFTAVQSAIGVGFSSMWNKVFGEVNSLFEALMKGIYDALIELAASALFKTILSIFTGGGSGFLSFLFSKGGYTGDGSDDEPAGIVHKNEFVVSSAGTSIPANRQLLESMNKGEDVTSGEGDGSTAKPAGILHEVIQTLSGGGFFPYVLSLPGLAGESAMNRGGESGSDSTGDGSTDKPAGVLREVIQTLSSGGYLPSAFSFSTGGYTGDGSDDDPAGVVHKNEFVVSSPGTSIPGNRELLEAMNRGEDVASLIGYAERRSVNQDALRSETLNNISAFEVAAPEKNISINIDGISVNSKIQKLTGLNENDWMEIVDDELIPQISKGLKRVGKEVLDSSIN